MALDRIEAGSILPLTSIRRVAGPFLATLLLMGLVVVLTIGIDRLVGIALDPLPGVLFVLLAVTAPPFLASLLFVRRGLSPATTTASVIVAVFAIAVFVAATSVSSGRDIAMVLRFELFIVGILGTTGAILGTIGGLITRKERRKSIRSHGRR